MNKYRIVLSILFFFLFIGNVYAEVYVGLLQKNPQDIISFCMQGQTHTINSNLDNGYVDVKGDMVDLSGFEGMRVIAFGEEEFVECSVIRVTAIYKTSANAHGIVAGTIKNTSTEDAMGAKQVGLSVVLTKDDFTRTYKVLSGENFYFNGLENGTYELAFMNGKTELSKVFVTVSDDSPLYVQNLDMSNPDVSSNAPLMDNIGFALTFMLIFSVMRSKFRCEKV